VWVFVCSPLQRETLLRTSYFVSVAQYNAAYGIGSEDKENAQDPLQEMLSSYKSDKNSNSGKNTYADAESSHGAYYPCPKRGPPHLVTTISAHDSR
jgi:hypothetical protein